MSKTDKKKSRKTVKLPGKDLQPPKEAINDLNEEKPFDFGGLPDRDLKKNLGCG